MENQTLDPQIFASPGRFFKALIIAVFVSLFIGFFLHTFVLNGSLYDHLMLSLAMGLSICTCINLALFIVRPRRYGYLYITVGAGLICGILIVISLFHVFSDNAYHLTSVWKALFLGVSLTIPVSTFFIIKHKLSDTRFKLQKEQIKALGNEKNALQSRLKLLQAQIEPHFLFNTLANIEGLQKKDGATAGVMLNNLTCYLRTSLKKTRKTSITLKEELTTIRAYLEIFQVRMGKRLSYRIEADDSLNDVSIPPMLIQPLVENSILHGLAPKEKGGGENPDHGRTHWEHHTIGSVRLRHRA
ncbi:MAG: hypothetical protein GY846_24735 [Deltaproteobacteria bacterium]|nr:hypothetical protein [Deltaproteobacteria bacterium]